MHRERTAFQQAKAAFDEARYAEAPQLLHPLAASGDAEAQAMLGCMYHLGLGVEADRVQAEKWYQLSSAQGYGLATNNLVTLCLSCWSRDPDIEKARSLYALARKQGFPFAPYLDSDGNYLTAKDCFDA